jgi:hypothetical protein
MMAVSTSETSVSVYHTTPHNVPENIYLYFPVCFEKWNIKSQLLLNTAEEWVFHQHILFAHQKTIIQILTDMNTCADCVN